MVKIYTKTGDTGQSGLYSGERLPKSDIVFDCLGGLDEINASLGVCASLPSFPEKIREQLHSIQGWLIDCGACVATPSTEGTKESRKVRRTRLDVDRAATLESWIDELEAVLPRLTRFILPSGGMCASHLHLSRTICRRTERVLVALQSETNRVEELADVQVFLNRLSDYLFVTARAAAVEPEVEYCKQ